MRWPGGTRGNGNRVKLVKQRVCPLFGSTFQTVQPTKKMSKVETLRSAVEYIRALQQLLDEHDAVSAAFQSGVLSPTIPQNCSNDMNSMAGSPVSSYSSDEGSYDPLSPEEQELLDFTNWFWTSAKVSRLWLLWWWCWWWWLLLLLMLILLLTSIMYAHSIDFVIYWNL